MDSTWVTSQLRKYLPLTEGCRVSSDKQVRVRSELLCLGSQLLRRAGSQIPEVQACEGQTSQDVGRDSQEAEEAGQIYLNLRREFDVLLNPLI